MAVNWTLALKIILWLWYWFNSIYVSFSLHKSSISILMRPKQCRPILLLTSLSVSRPAAVPPRGPGHRGRVRGGRGRGGQQPRALRHRGRAARHHLPLGAQHQHRPHQPRAAQVRYFLLIWYFFFYETYFLSISPSCRSAALSLTKHKIRWWPHILACEGLLLTSLHPQVLRHQDRAGRGAVLGLQPRGRGRVALRVQTCGCR